MIFVTVGTHEQAFDRLIKTVDELKKDGIIHDDVFMQIGYSDYTPQHCQYERVISYEQMNHYMNIANIIITHGGVSSFMEVIQQGKTPIVVPRLQEFNEHINNHQLDFTKAVIGKDYPIILIKDINDLKNAIINYKNKKTLSKSNNSKFNQLFKLEVDGLFL